MPDIFFMKLIINALSSYCNLLLRSGLFQVTSSGKNKNRIDSGWLKADPEFFAGSQDMLDLTA